MSLKTDNIQFGVSATPNNNFMWTIDGAGGGKLSRGSLVNGVPTPTSDLVAIGADDTVTILKPEQWIVTNPVAVPTSGNFTNVVSTLRTRKVGRQVFYHFSLDIVTLGTAGSIINVPLPYPAASVGGNREWNGSGRESSAAGNTIICWVKNGTSTLVVSQNGTLANGQLLNVSGFYESAA